MLAALCALSAVGCAAPPPKEPPKLAAAPESQGLLARLGRRFPDNGASVCRDVRLRLSFQVPVKLGHRGKIQLFQAGGGAEPVDSVDLEQTNSSELVGGRLFHTHLPIFIDGNDVTVAFASQALAVNASYFVTVDDGVFLGEDEASLGGITDPAAFRFSTRAPAPPQPSVLTVALDGSGDFCSIQGALDFVPAGSQSAVTIAIKNGVYHELVLLTHKNNITLRGESRDGTVLAYANNDNLQQKLGSKYRAMVSLEHVKDVTLERLTLHNLTSQQPPGGVGYQAEALRVDPGERVTLRDATFVSRQDTLQLTGSVYVVDSLVEGNVDFVWGKGVSYFERSEIRSVARPGYIVQSRNAPGTYGTVFVDSRLTTEPAVQGSYIARINGAEFPGSAVALVDCTLGSHFDPAGFLVTNTTRFDQLGFLEYRSKTLDGSLVDTSRRSPASRQMSDSEAKALRDKVAVLGWDAK